MASFHCREQYWGFKFFSEKPEVIEKARPLVESLRGQKRCAVNVDGIQYTPGGIYFPWRQPALYAAGYRFINGLL